MVLLTPPLERSSSGLIGGEMRGGRFPWGVSADLHRAVQPGIAWPSIAEPRGVRGRGPSCQGCPIVHLGTADYHEGVLSSLGPRSPSTSQPM